MDDGTVFTYYQLFEALLVIRYFPVHNLFLTVVYVQITLLWRYFTLEITLGYKYEFKSISAIFHSQA